MASMKFKATNGVVMRYKYMQTCGGYICRRRCVCSVVYIFVKRMQSCWLSSSHAHSGADQYGQEAHAKYSDIVTTEGGTGWTFCACRCRQARCTCRDRNIVSFIIRGVDIITIGRCKKQCESLTFRALSALPTPVSWIHNRCEPSSRLIDSPEHCLPSRVSISNSAVVEPKLCHPVRHGGHECCRSGFGECVFPKIVR